MMCYNDWGHCLFPVFSLQLHGFSVAEGWASWLLPLLFWLPLQVGTMLPKHALRVAKDPSVKLSAEAHEKFSHESQTYSRIQS